MGREMMKFGKHLTPILLLEDCKSHLNTMHFPGHGPTTDCEVSVMITGAKPNAFVTLAAFAAIRIERRRAEIENVLLSLFLGLRLNVTVNSDAIGCASLRISRKSSSSRYNCDRSEAISTSVSPFPILSFQLHPYPHNTCT